MNLTTKYMTRNDCYNAGRKITPSGIMVHSTATPGAMAEDFHSAWNKSYKAGEMSSQVCVHAFVDDTGVLQTLPWDHRGWHCGGSANNSHISFEICEPSGFTYGGAATMIGYDAAAQEPYFRKVWVNAVELCAFLCQLYSLTEQDITCHSAGHSLGIASNHADVMHWLPKHDESMETFRVAVKAALSEQEDENMTQDTFNELMDTWQAEYDPLYETLDDVPSYWRNEVKNLVDSGVIKGDGINSLGLRRSTLKAAIICKRYLDR